MFRFPLDMNCHMNIAIQDPTAAQISGNDKSCAHGPSQWSPDCGTAVCKKKVFPVVCAAYHSTLLLLLAADLCIMSLQPVTSTQKLSLLR